MKNPKLRPSTSVELFNIFSTLKMSITGCSNCPFYTSQSSFLDGTSYSCNLIKYLDDISISIDTNQEFRESDLTNLGTSGLYWDIPPDEDDPEDTLEEGTYEKDKLIGYYHKKCPLKQLNQIQIVSRLTTTDEQVESYINMENFFNQFDSNNDKLNIISGDFNHYEISMLNQVVQLHRKKLPYDKPIIIFPEQYFLSVNDLIKFVKSTKEIFSKGGILITNNPEVIQGVNTIFEYWNDFENFLGIYIWSSDKQLINHGTASKNNFIYLTEFLHSCTFGENPHIPGSITC